MTAPARSSSAVVALLSAMMFLQFFVWGSWYVSMTGFINRMGMSGLTPAAYSVGPIAAILSPFFLGLIADRFFATERVLGVMQILGGVFLCAAPSAASAFTPDADAGPIMQIVSGLTHPFIIVLLLHMLCYMPTLGLTTTLAFHNLPNREKQFPLVRVWGTIGWIVGNLAVSLLPAKDAAAEQFYLAGGAAVVLGAFSFFLPHTPAPGKGKKTSVREILGLDSLALLKQRSYLVFVVCSFLLCIPLAGYYNWARNFVENTGSVVNDSATFTMSFGQMSEILFMLVMPLCFRRLGVKWMLAIGMLAWVVRYGLFAGAWDDRITWMVIGGVLLHGICYDFFFVTGMIYVDKAANPTIRGQAQGFLVLITQGLGMLIGAQAFGWLVNHYKQVPVFVQTPTPEELAAATAYDWKMIWAIPAGFALAVLIAFVLLFRERHDGTGVTPPVTAPEPELTATTGP
ncbi:MAG: MFS transporter [Phycisphaeraceae bacterium]|nr:MFS transporter [Phycisphaeraceae bacterium]